MFEYPIGDAGKVFGDAIWFDFVFGESVAARAGKDERGAGTGVDAGLDVGGAVAHHDAFGKVEFVVAGGSEDVFRFGFPAVAVVFGMMRTNIIMFDVDAGGVEVLVEEGVDFLDGFASEIAATDAGLVGDDEEEVAGGVEALEGGDGGGDEEDAVNVADVVGVLHEDAVAVEENGFHGRRL